MSVKNVINQQRQRAWAGTIICNILRQIHLTIIWNEPGAGTCTIFLDDVVFFGEEKLRPGNTSLYGGSNLITGNRYLFAGAQIFERKLPGVDLVFADNQG